jgi:hypothetical protein
MAETILKVENFTPHPILVVRGLKKTSVLTR